MQLLKLSSAPAEDAADALAVALCHAQTSRALAATGAKGYARGRLK